MYDLIYLGYVEKTSRLVSFAAILNFSRFRFRHFDDRFLCFGYVSRNSKERFFFDFATVSFNDLFGNVPIETSR